MTSATLTTLGECVARRNRVALLALMPLIVFALGACGIWANTIFVFFGLFFIFIPLGFALALTLIWANFVGLASLGSMLWDGASARRWRRATLAALLGFAYIGFWLFLRDSIVRNDAGPFLDHNFDWAVAALWAQAAYPLVAGLMATLILLPERAPSRVTVWRGLLVIGLVWAFLLTALGPALDWARDDIRFRQISLLEERSYNRDSNPIVVAVCTGRLDKAAELIRVQGYQLSESDVGNLQGCMNWYLEIPRSYAERVGLVLDVILAWEARGASQAPQGCTAYQKSLLREVYKKSNFPDTAVQAFVVRGLPITCPLEPGELQPVWWEAFGKMSRLSPLAAQRLPRLQALGIDLQQTDSKGLGLVAANPEELINSLNDAELLSFAELGLRDQPGGRTPHALVIEVMKRRHGLGADIFNSRDLLRAFQLVGEPTDEQLREVMERAPWMLNTDRAGGYKQQQERKLRDAIAQRLKSK